MSKQPEEPSDASAARADDEHCAGIGVGALWTMLVREPHTGVGVVTSGGQIVYLNDQAAKLFHGVDAVAKDYIGRVWNDHMPEEWTSERLEVLARIERSGVPVLMRTIWRGFQHFTWIYPIQQDADEPARFLTLTRRAQDDAEAEKLVSSDEYTWIDSKCANFGKLDVLSDRELEVLALLGQGLSIEDAGKVLFRSAETIKSHRRSIGEKLGICNRAQITKIAARAGLRLEDAELDRVASEVITPSP